MNIGIPKELKPFEGRVALSPSACSELISKGHHLYLETSAGNLSGFTDKDYQQSGVNVCQTPQSLYDSAELIVKVKEPLDVELQYLTENHTLFCFLHLAANPKLVEQLSAIGLTAVGFESVIDARQAPLLKPMSQIAGRLAVQTAAELLHLQHGGSGVLLGGLGSGNALTNVDRGQVLVLGAGSAGTQAALLAQNMGAKVYVFDHHPAALEAIRTLDKGLHLFSDKAQISPLLATTDVLVGALLVPGKKAPHLIKRHHVKMMRAGSVIVDISVDQGGCIETTQITTYDKPTFVEEGVTHFCVANMPGAVPRTATQVLSVLLPEYVHRLTKKNWYESDKIMREAVNLRKGKLCIDI